MPASRCAQDGVLSFDEFRSFYNAAVEDAKGLRPQAKLRAVSPTKCNESPTKAKRKWSLATAALAEKAFHESSQTKLGVKQGSKMRA